MGGEVILIGLLHRRTVIAVVKTYVLKLRGKRRMTAVIGPVGVQYADLRHGRVALLLILKIILDM